MEDLKATLAHNTVLRSLFLWGTKLHDEGCIVLAESLTENTSLYRLELRFNDIGLAGILAFRCCCAPLFTVGHAWQPHDAHERDAVQADD